MKILLLKEVKNVGHKGEVKDVADGYARNFLIPQKQAVVATEGNIKNLQKQIEKKVKEKKAVKKVRKSKSKKEKKK